MEGGFVLLRGLLSVASLGEGLWWIMCFLEVLHRNLVNMKSETWEFILHLRNGSFVTFLSKEECNHQYLACRVEAALQGARLPGSLPGGVAKTHETVCFERRDLCLYEQEVYGGDEVAEIISGRQELMLLQHLRILNKAVVIISGHGKRVQSSTYN